MSKSFYEKWNKKEFTRAEELQNYLNEIKPLLVGKSLSKIMMMGVNFNDNSENETAGLWVDEPLVFFIGDNRLEIDQNDMGSHIFISINQLTLTENSYQNKDCIDYKAPPHIWQDISGEHFKNCINQIVQDIYIKRTTKVSDFDECYCSGNDGDDMFCEFCIKFQNGYEIVFSTIMDYSLVTERKV